MKCNMSDTDLSYSSSLSEDSISYGCHYPMYTMDMATFLSLDTLRPHEEMQQKGRVHQWKRGDGPIIFLSHQWTSFSHPDHTNKQLHTVQAVLRAIIRGEMADLFTDPFEWRAFARANAPFTTTSLHGEWELLSPQGMAEEVAHSQIWIDYACVPQYAENQKERLLAIDSIPWYIDHSMNFFVVVPPIEHSELPGVSCDYYSWKQRGWCRLEEQVQELGLAPLQQAHLHRRPVVIHGERAVSSFDAHDNFYTGWNQTTSIFHGDFTCCRFNHIAKVIENGKEVERAIPCDKERIRPMVAALWDRKIAHEAEMPRDVKSLSMWRWISHKSIMLADDHAEEDDAQLKCLDDITTKYMLLTHGMEGFIKDQMYQCESHISLTRIFFPDLPADRLAGFMEYNTAYKDLMKHPEKHLLQVCLSHVVAEGHLGMVRLLHEEHGADLHFHHPWGLSMLEYAAGKGHCRVLKYILDHGGAAHINDKTPRIGISALDRACKAGLLDVLRLLVEYGVSLETTRFDGSSAVHAAASMGHVHILRELHTLGCNMSAPNLAGDTPRMIAKRCHHLRAAAFLESLE